MGEVDFDKAPFTVVWEVTRACALACKHCRAEAQPRRHPEELDHDEGMALLDQIKEFGNPIMVFTGGDPMMRRDLFDLLGKSVDIGLRTSLTPTATALVTRERLERVRETGISRVALSLDGPDAETHDYLRGFKGTFDRTIDILKTAQDVGLSVQVNTSVTRNTAPKLRELVPMLTDLGIVQWSVFFLVPTGRGQHDDMISAEEHEDLFNWLWELSKESPFDIKSTAAQHYRRVAIQREKALAQQEGEQRSVTFAGAGFQYADGLHRPMKGVNDGRGIVFISHTGDVCPSGFLPLVGGNIRDRSLVDIYRDSSLFRELRDTDLLKGKCGVCEYKTVCGGNRGRAYAMTGDYLASESLCVHEPAAVAAHATA
ncbi:TIGR04053 family radical SAM/SPASM domain-containing protein [Candidatus Poribacteria bacterium]|nr:TIGR04053 family radical SAM/SPASM domain-containing protein [Candidatus Poribacteria bacterium]MBT5534023.1 TIGR04053 family radical SAM/SPASM domain-containing protein [Candidatus Poribacteria bacterium]MBT5709686.1 TIGR04053 family radical SAM/SPASM domain-containing protein [Candidatus Poribacteria bacterium]MBT7101229.1 TIGR04053 family radical SAM/SPASM domain-containing protein [Candidatus Poribacteria bacterium]MBT7804707.1 TIGR04053 family radical SAM/SPASM domain-containing protein